MISIEKIKNQLNNTLEETNFLNLGQKERGKVRDNYIKDDKRTIITTDRISAFDCILGTIPFKGQVLNQMAAFWFDKTKNIVANHVIDVPDQNVMVVKDCKALPVEMVIRAYITGVTTTSAWYNYGKGVRIFCGNRLPEGMRKNQKFDNTILTPSTKIEEKDRSVSREEVISEGLITEELFDKMAEISFKLFKIGSKFVDKQGLILVDTKYEFGLCDGELVLIDEIHTPDSSRFWFKDTYDILFQEEKEQRKLDKEYVREWMAERGFIGKGEPPNLTNEVRIEAAKKYIQAFELITGKKFKVINEPIEKRIINNLKQKGYV